MSFCPIIKEQCKQDSCEFYNIREEHCGIKTAAMGIHKQLWEIGDQIQRYNEKIRGFDSTLLRALDNIRLSVQSQTSMIHNMIEKPALGEWSPQQVDTIVQLLKKLYPNEDK